MNVELRFLIIRLQAPGPAINMSQYVIDWRNAEAADYFVSAIVNATFLPGSVPTIAPPPFYNAKMGRSFGVTGSPGKRRRITL